MLSTPQNPLEGLLQNLQYFLKQKQLSAAFKEADSLFHIPRAYTDSQWLVVLRLLEALWQACKQQEASVEGWQERLSGLFQTLAERDILHFPLLIQAQLLEAFALSCEQREQTRLALQSAGRAWAFQRASLEEKTLHEMAPKTVLSQIESRLREQMLQTYHHALSSHLFSELRSQLEGLPVFLQAQADKTLPAHHQVLKALAQALVKRAQTEVLSSPFPAGLGKSLYSLTAPFFELYTSYFQMRLSTYLLRRQNSEENPALPKEKGMALLEEGMTLFEVLVPLELYAAPGRQPCSFAVRKTLEKVLESPDGGFTSKQRASERWQVLSARFEEIRAHFTDLAYWFPSRQWPVLCATHQIKLAEIRKAFFEAWDLTKGQQAYQQALIGLLRDALTVLAQTLGAPPCAFSVGTMGSLARGDMGAYSDLDLFLLIQKAEFQAHSYFQVLLQSLETYLVGLGEPWDGELRQCLGLHLDGGDLKYFRPLKQEDFALLHTPEGLSEQVWATLSAKRLDGQFILAFSLLDVRELYASSEKASLFQAYQTALRGRAKPEDIRAMGWRHLQDVAEHVGLERMQASQVVLKDIFGPLTMMLMGLQYAYQGSLQGLKFSQADFMEAFKTVLDEPFLKHLSTQWEGLHVLRLKAQTRLQRSHIRVRELEPPAQAQVRECYELVLLPLASTVLKAQTSLEALNSPWQAHAMHLSEKHAQSLKLASYLGAHFLHVLVFASEQGRPLKLKPAVMHVLWQQVLQTVKAQGMVSEGSFPTIQGWETPWGGLKLGAVLKALVQASQEAGAREETALEEALQAQQDAWALCLMEAGMGRSQRPSSRALLEALQLMAARPPDPAWGAALEQAHQRLAPYHPELAWVLHQRLLFQLQPARVPGFPATFTGEVEGALSGKRYLSEAVLFQVLESDGKGIRFKGSNVYGVRKVAKVVVGGQTFYLKLAPEAPDREAAVYRFSQQLFGGGVPYGELFKWVDLQGKAHKIWISQGIEGLNLQSLLNALSPYPEVQRESRLPAEQIQRLQSLKPFERIEGYSFAIQFFLTTLLIQEDGKPDNLVVEAVGEGESVRFKLVSIDNDHAFYEPVSVNEQGRRVLHLKSFIYCLPNMQSPLHAEVVHQFLQLDNDSEFNLKVWLEGLLKLEARYQALFPLSPEETAATSETQLRFHLPPRILPKVFQRWERLKTELLKDPLQPAIELLRKTIPYAGSCYATALTQHREPGARFTAIAGNAYTSTKVRDTVVRYETTTRIRDQLMFQSRSQALLKEGPGYTIAAIQAELEQALHEHERVQEVIAVTQRGHLERLSELLLERSISAVIAKLGWGRLNLLQQEAVLRFLKAQQVNFEALTLQRCQALSDVWLKELLLQSPSLEQLTLLQVPDLTDKLGETLSLQALGLQHLVLQGLPGMKRLGRSSNKPLLLPHLKRLTLADCKQLQTIGLEAPLLEHLTLMALPRLTTWSVATPLLERVEVEDCQLLEKLQTQSEKAEMLKLGHCSRLRLEGLSHAFNQGIHLKTWILPAVFEGAPGLASLVPLHPWLLAFSWGQETALTAHQRELLEKLSFEVLTEKERGVLHAWVGEGRHLADCSEKLERLYHHAKGYVATRRLRPQIAAVSLGYLQRATPETLECLVQALRDKDWDVRQAAAKALGQLGQGAPEVVSMLLRALRGTSSKIRFAAAEALGQLGQGTPEVVLALLRALRGTSLEIRFAAAEALGQLGQGTPEVVEGLLRALGDKAELMRNAAAKVLGQLGQGRPEVVSGLLRALGDADWSVRQRAAGVLGQLGQGTPEVALGLLRALGDKNKYVRRVAAEALARLGGPLEVPLLHRQVVFDALFKSLSDPTTSLPILEALELPLIKICKQLAQNYSPLTEQVEALAKQHVPIKPPQDRQPLLNAYLEKAKIHQSLVVRVASESSPLEDVSD